jgi:site-specific recombinase XerD
VFFLKVAGACVPSGEECRWLRGGSPHEHIGRIGPRDVVDLRGELFRSGSCRDHIPDPLSGRGLASNTLRAYDSDLKEFQERLGRSTLVDQVRRNHLQELAAYLLDEKGLKATTVRRRLATLKVFFRWLEFQGTIPLSPFHRLNFCIRLPKRLPRALDSSEMRLLLRRADTEVRGAAGEARAEASLMQFSVTALFTTGLRIGELVAARVADVSLPDAAIQVCGKGNRERRVYLPGLQATTVLARFLSARRRLDPSTDLLLVLPSGVPADAPRIRKRLGALAQRAGIARRVTPHMLRHTAATQLSKPE